MFEIILTCLFCAISEIGLFAITEQLYCNKYLFKNRVGCKCWSCRFYSKCRYVKRGVKYDK